MELVSVIQLTEKWVAKLSFQHRATSNEFRSISPSPRATKRTYRKPSTSKLLFSSSPSFDSIQDSLFPPPVDRVQDSKFCYIIKVGASRESLEVKISYIMLYDADNNVKKADYNITWQHRMPLKLMDKGWSLITWLSHMYHKSATLFYKCTRWYVALPNPTEIIRKIVNSKKVVRFFTLLLYSSYSSSSVVDSSFSLVC